MNNNNELIKKVTNLTDDMRTLELDMEVGAIEYDDYCIGIQALNDEIKSLKEY